MHAARIEAAHLAQLVENDVGSLLVCDSTAGVPEVGGVTTERDTLRSVATHSGRLDELRVSDMMTMNLITLSPRDRNARAMGLITEDRIEHLPVTAQGKRCGNVVIGDVVKRIMTSWNKLAIT